MKKWWIGVIGIVVACVVVMLVWHPWSSTDPEEANQADRAPAAVTVRTVEAERGDVQAWVFAEGTARSVEREYLTFENAGRIAYIKPGPGGGELREGDPVKAGVVLARQDQRRYDAAIRTAESRLREAQTQLAVTEAELEQARTDQTLARTTFDRYEALLKINSASQQEFDQAQAQAANAGAAVTRAESRITAARAQADAAEAQIAQENVSLEETELRSPIDGIIAYLNIEEGFYFSPTSIRTDNETAALQSVPIVVIDPSHFEVTVNVPAYERQRLATGQPVLIITGAQTVEDMARGEVQARSAMAGTSGGSGEVARLPDSPVRGEVFAVTPAIKPGGRSVQVKVRTTRGGEQLEDGQFVTVWIATEQREQVMLAPLGAFTYRDNQPIVYVVDPQTQTVAMRPVELGLQGFGVQQIVSGVQPGDQLVTEGRFQLSDGARVRVIGDPVDQNAAQTQRVDTGANGR